MAEKAYTFLDAGEWAHPFGVGPWHFEGETLTIFVESDPASLQPYFPSPIEPSGAPIFRLTVHALRSDCGMGHEWAARNPRRSQFHEAVVAFNAEIDGVEGNWDPFMWTEAEPQLCVGREMYGFSMRLGEIALTRRPALRGWRKGEIVTAECSQDGRLAFAVTMTLGVSVYAGEPDATACINRADSALYLGKAAGRNRVATLSADEAVQPEMPEHTRSATTPGT